MMVLLSLTPYRTAAVLRRAADDLEAHGWDPVHRMALYAIDRAADYRRPGDPQEHVTVAAVDALAAYLGVEEPYTQWETAPGRTVGEVVAAVRAAADRLVVPRDVGLNPTGRPRRSSAARRRRKAKQQAAVSRVGVAS